LGFGVWDLRIEWLRQVSALPPIETAWRALEDAVSHRTHVSTFDFLATWYSCYAGNYGGTPLIGLAWDGADLQGIAPLTIRKGHVGRIPVTRVDFAPNDSIAGEFLVQDDRPDLVAALLDSLAGAARFDVACLNGFEPESRQLAALQDAAPKYGFGIEFEDHACAVVDLSGGYDTYRAGLSAHYRRNLNQRTRKAEEAGIAVEGILLNEGAATLEDSIARMIAINEASYKLEGRRLADCHRRFLAEVARRFAARGMLGLPILTIGQKDAAFILGVIERGCFYDVTLAYDESYAKLSPGSVLMQKTLERLPSLGVRTVLSHGAHEYKKFWATAFVPQQRLFLFAPRPRAMATRFVRFGLQPLWKRFGAHGSWSLAES
jgi:CelD/BcsL family acetyltransferase involved in cellulose biosynthesis